MMGLIPGEYEGRNLKSAPASLDSLNHIVYVMDGCVVQYNNRLKVSTQETSTFCQSTRTLLPLLL